MEEQNITAVLALNLSPAFDTVDHDIDTEEMAKHIKA